MVLFIVSHYIQSGKVPVSVFFLCMWNALWMMQWQYNHNISVINSSEYRNVLNRIIDQTNALRKPFCSTMHIVQCSP